MKNINRTSVLTVAILSAVTIASYFLMVYEPQALFITGTVILAMIALIVNGFVIVYSTRNWRANPYGRAIMYSKISLALLCDISLATAFLGQDWEWRPFFRVVLFSIILVAQARLLQLLFSTKHKANDKEFNNTHDRTGQAIEQSREKLDSKGI